MYPRPFTNMAVSLSGGGYRATTFHLGALAYLYHRQFQNERLLQRVKIISTISGGTITGVMYALHIAQGKGFVDCFRKINALLEEDQLVDNALHKLNNPGKWKNKHKTRDLINAFSEVYNEQFTNGATFKTLFESKNSHIKDAVFSGSEFTHGYHFRMQEQHDYGRFGNYYMSMPVKVAENVRLADAIAASSCFPGGFEPIIMPTDFGDGPESAVNEYWYSDQGKKDKYPTTAIMDGGIIDNQGIDGILLAENRHSDNGKNPFIGSYFVSDVSGQTMKPYEVPELKHNHFKNIWTINLINYIAAMVGMIALIVLFSGVLGFWGTVISSAIIPFCILWFVLYFFVRSSLLSAVGKAFGEQLLPELAKDFRVLQRTPIYILSYLIKFRLTSVVKMVSDVFLRRIRQLQNNDLYGHDDWNYRVKANNIYSLKEETSNREKEMFEKAGLEDLKDSITKEMKKVVEAANSMPTTLWFSETEKENHMLRDLITCGQFTMCYNVHKYINYLQCKDSMKVVWNSLSKEEQKDLLELQENARKDWQRFRKEVYWLYDELNIRS